MHEHFTTYGRCLAMPNRFDGYSSHIAPRADYSLLDTMSHLKTLGIILRALNLVHLLLIAIGLLALLYMVIYYYLVQALNFPVDFVYLKINELHCQWLGHPIGDRDVAYLILFTFLFIADNIVFRAGRCMKTAEDHSMAVIGAFLACIPVLNTVSLPFGLLALLLLLKPPVEKQFR